MRRTWWRLGEWFLAVAIAVLSVLCLYCVVTAPPKAGKAFIIGGP